MPAPGDQHATSIANPFDAPQRHMSEYTAQEIATLQSRLEKQLGPEYLSARTGPSGQKVHYIAADKCIALANEVFGFNGWSSAIKEIQVDFVDEHPQTFKISLGLSVIVRVTLRDGTFHEDIGYGHIENCSGKAKAFEKAKKEGTTDALKRALRSFGNVLGNCIYDKEYVKKVTKMKVQPHRSWDETGLHRHADFTKEEKIIKAELGPSGNGGGASGPAALNRMPSGDDAFFEDLLGEFDEADFNIVDDEHPDEICIPQSEKPTAHINDSRPKPPGMQPHVRALARSQSAGNPVKPPQTPGQAATRPQPPYHHQQNHAGPRPQHPLQQQQTNQSRPAPNHNNNNNINAPAHQTTPQPQGQGAAPESVGFFSARAVKQISGSGDNEEPKLPTAPVATQAFNPHAESPSIRKTPGIDHTKSKPVARNGQHIAPVERNDAGDELGKGPGQPVPATAAGVGRVGAGASGNGGFNAGNSNGNMGGQQQGPMPSQRGNMVNPQLNQARRIGAPMGPGSPMTSRGQYRPPTIKRPLPSEGATAAGRPALAEVSVNGAGGQGATGIDGGSGVVGGGDPKRQKMG